MDGLFGPDPLSQNPTSALLRPSVNTNEQFGLAAERPPVDGELGLNASLPASHPYQQNALPFGNARTQESRPNEGLGNDAGKNTRLKPAGRPNTNNVTTDALFGPLKDSPKASAFKSSLKQKQAQEESFGLQADLRNDVATAAAATVSFGFEAEAQKQQQAGPSAAWGPYKANAKKGSPAKEAPAWMRSPNIPAFLQANQVCS